MLIECSDFYETETSFLSKNLNYHDLELTKAKLVVKAFEKEISTLYNDLIIAKIHRDNNCSYPFSKVDFLSHKLQEIIYPQCVPKIHFGIFDNNEEPMFILERVPLDKLHIAYNIKRQKYTWWASNDPRRGEHNEKKNSFGGCCCSLRGI